MLRTENTEALVAFLGLYSGDGSKGTEDRQHIGVIKPSISFSQKEPNFVKFAVMQFQALFSHNISFQFSLGEDSAFFMAGEGKARLETYYGKNLPAIPELHKVKPNLNEKDKQYLKEHRPVDFKRNPYRVINQESPESCVMVSMTSMNIGENFFDN